MDRQSHPSSSSAAVAATGFVRSSAARPWLAPTLLTLAIWTTLPFVSALRRWVQYHVGAWAIRYLATSLFVVVAAAAVRHFVWTARSRDARLYARLAVLATLYCICLELYAHEPIEQMHLFEYGLLAVLVLRALPEPISGARRPLLALAIVGVLGYVDERLQGFIQGHYDAIIATLATWFGSTPERVQAVFFRRFFDWRDMRLNLTSGTLGLAAWALWSSAAQPAPSTEIP